MDFKISLFFSERKHNHNLFSLSNEIRIKSHLSHNQVSLQQRTALELVRQDKQYAHSLSFHRNWPLQSRNSETFSPSHRFEQKNQMERRTSFTDLFNEGEILAGSFFFFHLCVQPSFTSAALKDGKFFFLPKIHPLQPFLLLPSCLLPFRSSIPSVFSRLFLLCGGDGGPISFMDSDNGS